jgi:hypothetical protein
MVIEWTQINTNEEYYLFADILPVGLGIRDIAFDIAEIDTVVGKWV